MSSAVLAGLVLAAVIFYLVIPALGAVFVRSRWRGFRRSVIEASGYPQIHYEDIRGRADEGAARQYHFLGVLEAIQDDDIIWLRNNELVLSADMKGQKVFLLPSQTTSREETLTGDDVLPLSDETPRIVAWEKVRSLPEGIPVLLAGSFRAWGDRPAHNRGLFRSEKKGDLLAVFYDGDNASLLRRAVWHGRQRNEYWNTITGVSMGAGVLTGMILSYFFLSPPISRIPAILSIIMSLVPIIPVLPPGLVFFIGYRMLWRRGRFLRAQRDLLNLPRRRFESSAVLAQEKTGLPDEHAGAEQARRCEKMAVRRELLSLALFSAGFLGNLYLVLRGLVLLIR